MRGTVRLGTSWHRFFNLYFQTGQKLDQLRSPPGPMVRRCTFPQGKPDLAPARPSGAAVGRRRTGQCQLAGGRARSHLDVGVVLETPICGVDLPAVTSWIEWRSQLATGLTVPLALVLLLRVLIEIFWVYPVGNRPRVSTGRCRRFLDSQSSVVLPAAIRAVDRKHRQGSVEDVRPSSETAAGNTEEN